MAISYIAIESRWDTVHTETGQRETIAHQMNERFVAVKLRGACMRGTYIS